MSNILLVNFTLLTRKQTKMQIFVWEEPGAKQGSQEEIEAFLMGQKAETTV